MSLWTTSTTGLDTVLATLGTSINQKSQSTNHLNGFVLNNHHPQQQQQQQQQPQHQLNNHQNHINSNYIHHIHPLTNNNWTTGGGVNRIQTNICSGHQKVSIN